MILGIPPELSIELTGFTASSRRIETSLGGKQTTPEALALALDQLVANREANRRLQIQVGRRLTAAKAEAADKQRRAFA